MRSVFTIHCSFCLHPQPEGSLGIHSQPHLSRDIGVELDLRDILPDLADLWNLHQALVDIPAWKRFILFISKVIIKKVLLLVPTQKDLLPVELRLYDLDEILRRDAVGSTGNFHQTM
jgi:hypothetical protein